MGPDEDKHPPTDGTQQPVPPEPIELEVLEEVVLEEVSTEAKPADAPAPVEPAKAPPMTVMDLIRAKPAPEAAAPTERSPEADRARLDAELKELGGLLRSTPALSFLKPRLAQLVGEGLDYTQLLSLYRIVARSFKDDLDKKVQMLKTMEDDFAKLQSKAEKMRSEMAGLQASARMASAAEKAMAQLAPPELPPPSVQAEMERKDKELAEFSGRLERMQQDFQNYRSRAKVDIDLSIARAREEWLRKILNVADNFERALSSSRDATAIDSLMKGVEMIQLQMMDILAAEGVKEIATVGEPFNPHLHDALMQEETDKHPDETVLKALTKGYTISGKVLRPAAVQISKMPAGKTYIPPGGKPATAAPVAPARPPEAAKTVRESPDTLKRLPSPEPEKEPVEPAKATKADPPPRVEQSSQQSTAPAGDAGADPKPPPDAAEAPPRRSNGVPDQEPNEDELEGWFADRMGKK